MVAARLIVPSLLHFIAKTRQRDLFILTILLICIGTAWSATLAGASLALGAFLGGLVVAGSDYRHQALSDLIPFREGFTSIFFVSVGMLLSPQLLIENIPIILLILFAILAGKFVIVFLTGLIMRLPLRVCVMAATALAQVGEFSFVLARASEGTGLFEDPLAENILAASILSMIITPFAISIAPHLAAGVGRIRILTQLLAVKTAEDAFEKERRRLYDHVIVGGYGVAGEELACSLRECDIPYVIVELNPDNVRKAVLKGEPAYYGDVTSSEVLHLLGADHARELVLVINDPSAIERAIKSARHVAPDLHIIVRTRYLLDVKKLILAGADKVVPEEIESAVTVVSQILQRYRIEEAQLSKQILRIENRIEE